MIRSCSNCLILAAMFQVIFGHVLDFNFRKQHPMDWSIPDNRPYQNFIPKHCWRVPYDIDVEKCCPRPYLYSNEVLKHCDIEPITKKSFNDRANSKPKGIPKKPCQDGICLMENANLLQTNGSVDYKKLGTYIDEWAAANPDFSEAILASKPTCGKERDESSHRGRHLSLCEPDRVFVCLMSSMLWNCKLKEFEECKLLEEHLKECKPYYYKSEKKTKFLYKYEKLVK